MFSFRNTIKSSQNRRSYFAVNTTGHENIGTLPKYSSEPFCKQGLVESSLSTELQQCTAACTRTSSTQRSTDGNTGMEEDEVSLHFYNSGIEASSHHCDCNMD